MRREAYDTLSRHLGQATTLLDHKVLDKLASGLMSAEWSEKEEWATFAQVFIELKNCGAKNQLPIFQYYFTGTTQHPKVLLKLLGDMKYKTDELYRLEEKILGYNF